MYIILAILVFGILIALHEFGHFVTAKLCGVQVNEFAIGMGPALLKKKKGETEYSLRLFPIGGFCAMEGEDEETGNPRAFSAQAVWKRLMILIAGSFMNFLAGFIVIVILFSTATVFVGNTITGFEERFPNQGTNGLMVGDTIVQIDGENINYANDFQTFMARSNGKTVDLVILRNGEKLRLNDFPLQLREYEIDGETVLKYGISFNRIEATFGEKLAYSWDTALDFVRLVRIGLTDLFSGKAGVQDMAGVVGIVDTIQDVGKNSVSVSAALQNIAYLCAFIAINLAVMNMLPIPALDGGRVFFLLLTWLLTGITRRHINPKYEGYIHAAGMVLLMGLMAFVMFNDIMRIIHG